MSEVPQFIPGIIAGWYGISVLQAFTGRYRMYDPSTPRFQMAAFESRDHMVYIISDMPKQQNRDLKRAMAPQLKSYLSKLEG